MPPLPQKARLGRSGLRPTGFVVSDDALFDQLVKHGDDYFLTAADVGLSFGLGQLPRHVDNGAMMARRALSPLEPRLDELVAVALFRSQAISVVRSGVSPHGVLGITTLSYLSSPS